MNTRMMFARAGGECCQCGNVAKTKSNFQLGTGNIGIGNTCTMATFNKMFARAVAGRFLDRIHKIDRIMKGVKRWKLTVNGA